MTEPQTPIDISVCIATFRRPDELRRLFASLRDTCADPAFRCEVLVVDNDAAGSARVAVEAAAGSLPNARYCIEEQQGISQARNRAVSEATGTWIAFIDDDEEACKGWLQAYWQAASTGDSEGYFGPVIPVAVDTPPAWFHDDVFFAYGTAPDGAAIGASHTRTGNALVRRDWLLRHRFDPAFGLTGGGDYELFARMIEAGATFRWCERSRTRDYIPANRLTFRWLYQRAFRGGYTYTTVERRRDPSLTAQGKQLVKALLGLAAFSFMLPFEILRGWRGVTYRLRRLCIQAGHLWAFIGPPVEPYRVEDTQ